MAEGYSTDISGMVCSVKTTDRRIAPLSTVMVSCADWRLETHRMRGAIFQHQQKEIKQELGITLMGSCWDKGRRTRAAAQRSDLQLFSFPILLAPDVS
jgi:hypothetical protein